MQGHVFVRKRAWRFVVGVGLAASLTCGIAAAESSRRYKQRTKPGKNGSWIVEVMGAPTDHPARVQGMAQLFAAQLVISKGFSHFRLLDTKKSVKCKVSKAFGMVEFGAVLVGDVFVGGKTSGNGFIAAQAFVAKNRVKLLAEPPMQAKREVESRLVSECTARQRTMDGLY